MEKHRQKQINVCVSKRFSYLNLWNGQEEERDEVNYNESIKQFDAVDEW